MGKPDYEHIYNLLGDYVGQPDDVCDLFGEYMVSMSQPDYVV